MKALDVDGFSTHWQSLKQSFPELGQTQFFIGLSGGLDSTTLVHLLFQILPVEEHSRITLVYVHHGLQSDADRWLEQTQAFAQQLALTYRAVHVNTQAKAGQSPEEAARDARYTAFSELLSPGDFLFTAHHQDDQAETVLLQLMRGAGPVGLSGMPVSRRLGEGQLLRPLLPWAREQLEIYARRHQLSWVEDPSNADTRFDRNFVRRQILPLLKSRWPAASSLIQRSAAHCASAQIELDVHVSIQLKKILDVKRDCIPVPALIEMGEVSAMQLLLAWCRLRQCDLPSTAHLERVWRDILFAEVDRQPEVSWGGMAMRRYQGQVYLMPRELPLSLSGEYCWSRGEDLEVEDWGRLSASRWPVKLDDVSELRVCFRSELMGRRHVKHWLQQHRVPPWLRDRSLFVLQDDEFITLFVQPLSD